MPRHVDRRTLPYRREELFNIIADVGSYPQFLPWCVGARLQPQKDNQFDADLLIGFKMFKEKFTSRVTVTPFDTVHVEYIKGPMKYLYNHWQLSNVNGGTQLDFEVDFEFRNPIFQKLVGVLFEEAVHKMIQAFEDRAKELLKPIS